MRGFKAVLLACLVSQSCVQARTPPGVETRAPEHPDLGASYVFYLHGRIVGDQGADAVSPDYGRYEYRAIVEQFAGAGFTVVSEVRPADTDPQIYANGVVRQIQGLLASGVPATNITVIGASKGAVIAMLVSTQLKAALRYVLLANCNEYILNTHPVRLHGHVLSIYEATDDLGRTCVPLFDRSPGLGERQEVRLTTGLRHGFIFRPLAAWFRPAIEWARGGA